MAFYDPGWNGPRIGGGFETPTTQPDVLEYKERRKQWKAEEKEKKQAAKEAKMNGLAVPLVSSQASKSV